MNFQKLLKIQYQNEKLKKTQFQQQTQKYTTALMNVLKYPCWCFSISHFLLDSKHLKEIINLLLFSKATYKVTFKLKAERILLTISIFKMSLIL